MGSAPSVQITTNPADSTRKRSSLSELSRKRKNEARSKGLWSIEDFVMEGMTQGQHRVETLASFLSTQKSRERFLAFLKFEFDDPPEQVLSFFSEIKSAVKVDEFEGTESAAATDPAVEAHNALILVMAMQAFTKFLSSPHYLAWRAEENAGTNAVTAEVAAIDILHDHRVLSTKASDQISFAHRAFQVLERQEINALVDAGSWLSVLISAAESLPIPFSLSTASSKRPGFPLIYVNPPFEALTGYTRDEIIGQNCRFLQGPETEPESVTKLTEALRGADKVKTRISNRRKDGSVFVNHLNMKPVFDQYGEYRYVIGLQFLVSPDDAVIADDERTNDRMLRCLPDQIFEEED